MSKVTKQTAVEWYIEKLLDLDYEYSAGLITLGVWSERKNSLIEQAKAMNKEQHRQTANVVRQEIFDLNYSSFDEYYNETFGGNNEQQ